MKLANELRNREHRTIKFRTTKDTKVHEGNRLNFVLRKSYFLLP